MNNNLRFPISDIAYELFGRMYNFAKEANVNAVIEDVTIIDESNKYELRLNNYKKYLKFGESNIQNIFYGAFLNVTEKGYSLILTSTQFKLKRLSFAGEHLEMRKQGYEYFCYPSKKNSSFVFISPSGAIKFNLPSSNKAVWLSLSNIKKFPFNYFGLNRDVDTIKLSKKLLFNNKKNEWCENHLERKRARNNTALTSQNNFSKSSYCSCSSLQQFINKIKTIDEPLSHKQFAGFSFDDIYEIMSVAPIFKNPIKYIDNYLEFKDSSKKVPEYQTYFDDLIKMANDVGQKINFSLNKDNIKEQHDRMLLDNLDKMKAKQIHVDDKYLILEKYLPKQFKMIKDGKELLFEGLTQKHCVNSYSDNINRGQCCILTTEYNEKRYTAEIIFGKSLPWFSDDNQEVYRINQFKGYANSSVPNELMSKLQDVINEVNKKEKKYITKIKGSINDPFETYEVVEYIGNPF